MRHVYYSLLDKALSKSNGLVYHESDYPAQDHRRLKELTGGRWLGSTETAGEWSLVLDNGSEVRFVKKLA